MPHIIFTTNVPVPDDKALVLQLGQESATILGKPIQAFMIQYKYDPNMAFAGSFDPAWMLQIPTSRSTDKAGVGTPSSTLGGTTGPRAEGGGTLAFRDLKKQNA
ncbi:hypothetical protein CALCODRAFT_510490 [Calocera cornea HHB12733]|uniref:Tautomerase/MIF n=1 Tax=Calocera cornea HHB12733 TaxID=1353952 RepID=A0A165EGG2_9BASI|nr:hypothetical protein CALCODRAFT_510490 [Calocera cornea HHB12733]